jgi:hypothetical protein
LPTNTLKNEHTALLIITDFGESEAAVLPLIVVHPVRKKI